MHNVQCTQETAWQCCQAVSFCFSVVSYAASGKNKRKVPIVQRRIFTKFYKLSTPYTAYLGRGVRVPGRKLVQLLCKHRLCYAESPVNNPLYIFCINLYQGRGKRKVLCLIAPLHMETKSGRLPICKTASRFFLYCSIVLFFYFYHRIPCSSMACATFIKPAMLAPLT